MRDIKYKKSYETLRKEIEQILLDCYGENQDECATTDCILDAVDKYVDEVAETEYEEGLKQGKREEKLWRS